MLWSLNSSSAFCPPSGCVDGWYGDMCDKQCYSITSRCATSTQNGTCTICRAGFLAPYCIDETAAGLVVCVFVCVRVYKCVIVCTCVPMNLGCVCAWLYVRFCILAVFVCVCICVCFCYDFIYVCSYTSGCVCTGLCLCECRFLYLVHVFVCSRKFLYLCTCDICQGNGLTHDYKCELHLDVKGRLHFNKYLLKLI